ncbi:asparagine synthase (glutamine-hydrolyzing) [Magnetospirillum gryphiswaldense]|nr:asparagine synthase (glutamine-hydrolyzing) [Magnetospirillum gryphiswaldense]
MEPHRLDLAMACVAHRGPDGEGRVSRRHGRLIMGHRRLSIFDPGAGGHQPMLGPSGDCLVFNGCIYNYLELRSELIALGHGFRTGSDTEVVLAAWREWGEAAFSRFNGTWALALHDAASDRLVISRDRLGVRPLYMFRQPGRMILASEIRAVVAASGQPVRVDAVQAFDFLSLGLSDHQDRTMVDGITQVPAGALWVEDSQGALTRRRYHDWPEPLPAPEAAQAIKHLPRLLTSATGLRLRAHVPVAAQLSGGMDSGAVAWAIGSQAQSMTAPFLGFFSYGYDRGGEEYNEIQAARQTRDHVAAAASFHEVRVDPTPSLDDIEAFLAAQEVPVSTPSPVAGLRLYRAMRKAGAVVALTGDGSDELFAGYTRRYLPVAWRDAVRSGALAEGWDYWSSPELHWRDGLARLVWSLPFPALSALMARRTHMAVLTDDFRLSHDDRLRDLAVRQSLPLAELGRVDAQGGALSQILRYADRNAMAVGMESRSPFLDYRVAELAMRLPMTLKVSGRGGKLPLRDAMAPFLPPRVIGGAKNRGLGHAEQFRVGSLDLGDLLAEPPKAASEMINAGRLARALRQHPSDPRLWWPVCFLLWLRQVERQWP